MGGPSPFAAEVGMRTGWLIAAAAVLALAVVAGGIAWFAWFKHGAMRAGFGEVPEIESVE